MWAAIAAIASAIITGAISWYQNDRNVQAQKDINAQNISATNKANEQNIQNEWDMWNATNEYNTPQAQMERYKEAGLNPNLIYGQSNTTNAISIPSMQTPNLQAPKYDYSGVEKAINMLKDIPFVKEQYDMIREEAKQKRIETLMKDKDLDIKEADAMEAEVRKHEAGSKLGDLDNWLKAYYNGAIAQAESFSKKNQLMESQKRVQDAMATLKEIEAKYADTTDENGPGYYELRNEALKLANSLKDIEIDWSEIERSIGASGGIVQQFVSMLRMFLK